MHGNRTGTSRGIKWNVYHIEMFTRVQDSDRDQDPLFPVPSQVPVPCSVNKAEVMFTLHSKPVATLSSFSPTNITLAISVVQKRNQKQQRVDSRDVSVTLKHTAVFGIET